MSLVVRELAGSAERRRYGAVSRKKKDLSPLRSCCAGPSVATRRRRISPRSRAQRSPPSNQSRAATARRAGGCGLCPGSHLGVHALVTPLRVHFDTVDVDALPFPATLSPEVCCARSFNVTVCKESSPQRGESYMFAPLNPSDDLSEELADTSSRGLPAATRRPIEGRTGGPRAAQAGPARRRGGRPRRRRAAATVVVVRLAGRCRRDGGEARAPRGQAQRLARDARGSGRGRRQRQRERLQRDNAADGRRRGGARAPRWVGGVAHEDPAPYMSEELVVAGGTAHAVELNIGRLREHRPSVVSNAGRRRGVARGLAKAAVTCCSGEGVPLLRDDWDASSRRSQVSADVVLESRCGGAAHDGNSGTAASALDVAALLAAGKTVRELSGVRLSNATAGFDGSSSEDGGSASLAEFATRSALEPADDGGDGGGGGGGGGGGAHPFMRVHKRLRVDLYSECGVGLLRFPRLSGAAMPPPTVPPMNNAPCAKQNTPRATPWRETASTWSFIDEVSHEDVASYPLRWSGRNAPDIASTAAAGACRSSGRRRSRRASRSRAACSRAATARSSTCRLS